MSSKALQEMNVKYIIVDEISMVPEIFFINILRLLRSLDQILNLLSQETTLNWDR